MKVTSLLLVLLLSFSKTVSAPADSTRNDSIRYFNQFLSGMLMGKDIPVSFSGTMMHGVKINRLSLSAGVSYDNYGNEWKTIPLFGTLGYDLTSIQRNSLSVQFSAGYARIKRISGTQDGFNYHENGGRYLQPSLSYRINAGNWSLYILGGYRLQRMKYVQTPGWWWGAGDSFRNEVTRDSNRMVLQIGFGWH